MDVQSCPPNFTPIQRITAALLDDPSRAIRVVISSDPLFFAGDIYMYLDWSGLASYSLFPTRASARLPSRGCDFYYSLVADQISSGTAQFVGVDTIP